jgi:hypothetical protein
MNEHLQKLSKVIRDCINPLVKIQKTAEVDDKQILSEIIDKLTEAQANVSNLQTTYGELENKLKLIEQWQLDESKYESFSMFSGVTVIVTKDGNPSAYCREWYCKHCFGNKKKSQLQPDPKENWQYFCPNCKTSYQLDSRDQEAYNKAHKYPESSSPDLGMIEPSETARITKNY